MKRDNIELLRGANPVPHEVAYPEHEIGRRVADIVDSEHVFVAVTPAGHEGRLGGTRRRLVPALAAAVILLVAVVSALVLGRGHGSGNGVAPGASPVTCTVSTDGGSKATRDRETQAAKVISTRLSGLGGTASAFSYDAAGGTIGFTPHGVSPARAVQACRASTNSIRPLVTRPVAVDKTAARSANPLASLTFTVPVDENAYARLTAAEQAQLVAAMSHYDCSHGSATLVCSDVNGTQQVFLLGPLIAGNADITSADAVGPSSSSTQWVVALSLQHDASGRLAQFTATHNNAGRSPSSSLQCSLTDRVPCADFLAFTNDGTVVSAPETQSSVSGGVIQVVGGFTENSAHALATDYTAAAIRLRAS